MTERILAAACRENDLVYTMPIPARHHTIMQHFDLYAVQPEDQGFILHDGRFVGREEGVSIAQAAGQIVQKTQPSYQLFSEDMW